MHSLIRGKTSSSKMFFESLAYCKGNNPFMFRADITSARKVKRQISGAFREYSHRYIWRGNRGLVKF